MRIILRAGAAQGPSEQPYTWLANAGPGGAVPACPSCAIGNLLPERGNVFPSRSQWAGRLTGHGFRKAA
jgi:hypothetical protein